MTSRENAMEENNGDIPKEEEIKLTGYNRYESEKTRKIYQMN